MVNKLTRASCLQMIESLDNANDMETLNLWKPLLGLLSAPEDEIRQQAAWVCGTAIQNNPKSQQAVRPSSALSAA